MQNFLDLILRVSNLTRFREFLFLEKGKIRKITKFNLAKVNLIKEDPAYSSLSFFTVLFLLSKSNADLISVEY